MLLIILLGNCKENRIETNHSIACEKKLHYPQGQQVGTRYEGGIYQLRKDIYQQVSACPSCTQHIQQGFIGVRFMVNCKAEVGNLEMEVMDTLLQSTEMEIKLLKGVDSICRNLSGWIVGKDTNDQHIDSYMKLLFQFQDGKLVDIKS